GDSGSLFVGFALAALAVRGSMKSSMAVAVLAPLLALALPILDTTIAIARRFFGGKGVFEPDAEHIHHRMLRKGLTPRWVVVIILFSVGTWVGVQQLGYADLGARQWMLRRGLVHPARREPPDSLPEGEPSGSRGDPSAASVLATRALSKGAD